MIDGIGGTDLGAAAAGKLCVAIRRLCVALSLCVGDCRHAAAVACGLRLRSGNGGPPLPTTHKRRRASTPHYP